MRVAVFAAQPYDREFLTRANAGHGHELEFLEPNLDARTAGLADGCAAVCVFVNDRLDRETLEQLRDRGVGLIALRCAGFNQVDVAAADALGLTVLRVPAYSPYAVAEHTVALMLALNRKIPRAVARVHEQNFSLNGLLGFDMHGRTVGIVGTGNIGTVVARIMCGFGCRVLACDPQPSDQCAALGAQYVPLADLARESDIVTLHCPLTPATHRIVSAELLERMRDGVMLINTSRGGLVDTRAVIAALKSGRVGSLGVDVYEEEADLFFRDLSERIIQDDVFARLLTFPNVIVTAHQAFFTREAMTNIAETTLQNIADFAAGRPRDENRVTGRLIAR